LPTCKIILAFVLVADGEISKKGKPLPLSTFDFQTGGQDEEKRKDKSFEGSSQEKECQKFIEKIERGKKIPHLIRPRTVGD
jgi:hypothetical protein